MQKQKGFTIIELIVVIAIIAVLASIILVNVNGFLARGRDGRRISDIAQIQKALEMYYADNGAYPISGGSAFSEYWDNSPDSSWGALQTALKPYLSKLPVDPLENYSIYEFAGTPGQHHYSYFTYCGTSYMIVYNLEIASGPDTGAYACYSNFYYGGKGNANTNIKTRGTPINPALP